MTVVIDTLAKDQTYTVGDGEKKTFVIFLTAGKDQEGDIRIEILGEHAQVQILGVILGNGANTIHIETLQDHQKGSSVSDLLIKSVLFDRAKLMYRGLINIAKGAQRSNAYQKNQNLLLSKQAWADSRPYLEILANDVRCTHGATIGKIDPEQLYYFATRGLSTKQSQHIIVEGFLTDVLTRITDTDIRDTLRTRLVGRLNTVFAHKEDIL